MDKSTLLRYKGYIKTPSLFKTSYLENIDNIELSSEFETLTTNIEFKNKRLGKLVEEFVFYQLQQKPSVKWIVENLQIQQGKQTIGELDALYYQNKQPIHLEVVYKFYLYDTLKTYTDPLAYWIGPNRKDTLCYKLEKLKNKQFPLLLKEEATPLLTAYNINPIAVSQKLCFKAQLFLPHTSSTIGTEPLNANCISGCYIPFEDMSIFRHLKFYKPQKLDWLITPHNAVKWVDYNTIKIQIKEDVDSERSPLVWIKYNETKLVKYFITFW
ncbi:DUF1853 family protein [Winogradskyella sp. PC D3.3]